MSPAEILAVRWQIDAAQQRVDHEFGELRLLLEKLQEQWRAQQQAREELRRSSVAP